METATGQCRLVVVPGQWLVPIELSFSVDLLAPSDSLTHALSAWHCVSCGDWFNVTGSSVFSENAWN